MTDETDAPFWDLERYRARPGGAGGGGGGGAVATPEWDAPPPRPQGRPLALGYGSDPARLFGTALWGCFLTILTLGIYRFWMITRLRRFYWGAVQIDGDPLEYTGTPIEKLLGFLLALVLLALYLGLVNLGLTFVGLSIATDDPVMLNLVLQISVLATIPLIFYATYRGQRYLMARTRWRGIRFGLGPGAWGYTVRGCLLSLLSIVTLGLAWPFQQFRMAKYITDRTWFGDLKFEQEGSWTELFAQWIQLYLAAAALGLMIWAVADNPGDPMAAFFGGVALSMGGLLMMLMLQRYQIAAFRILWSNRRLEEAEFANDVATGRVLFYMIGGAIAVMVVSVFAAVLLGVAGYFLLEATGLSPDPAVMEAMMASNDPAALTEAGPAALLVVLGYLVFFAIAYALTQIFVTSPVLSAKTRAMTVRNVEALEASRQREHDRAAEAGGFADALGVDIGAGV
jgi:uncharacterized membrane protein YjgN (DUF898 family)